MTDKCFSHFSSAHYFPLNATKQKKYNFRLFLKVFTGLRHFQKFQKNVIEFIFYHDIFGHEIILKKKHDLNDN